jgi:hypothetical protein
MKKILFLCLLFMPFCAFSTDMCARDDTMVFILDPYITAQTSSGSNVYWEWYAVFPYGRIAGESTCLSQQERENITYSENIAGLHGTDEDGNERRFCYCRMTHPLVSPWILYSNEANASDCISYCANARCAATFLSNGYANVRKGLYDSIGR